MKNTPDESAKVKYSLCTKKSVNYAFETIKTIIFVFAVMSVLFIFVVRDANVVGTSMMNTLHDGDKVLLTDILYKPHVNDIVAINAENSIEKRIIKRVIATEGQTIKIDYDTGEVCVDGVILEEKYVSSFTKKPNNDYAIPYVVPKGKIFVMGDNRYVSLDSRNEDIGLVSVSDVIGKAQFIFFPFDRIEYLYN